MIADRNILTDRIGTTSQYISAGFRPDRYIVITLHISAALIPESNILQPFQAFSRLVADNNMRCRQRNIAGFFHPRPGIHADCNRRIRHTLGAVPDSNTVYPGSQAVLLAAVGIQNRRFQVLADLCTRTDCNTAFHIRLC